MGRGPEVDEDRAAPVGERLAGAQRERHPGPAQVADQQGDLGERLGAAGRVHARLVA
jgi:hypothetical protein